MKKILSMLLSLCLLMGAFAVPAQAATTDELLKLLRQHTATEAPAETPAPEETPAAPAEEEPPADDNDAPAGDEVPADEDAAAADDEAPAESQDASSADASFVSGYVAVKAGTMAYKTAALTSPAGTFTADGTVFALTASGTALEAAFVNANTRQTTVVYLPLKGASVLDSSKAAVLKTTLTLKKAPKYEGFPLPTIAFEAARPQTPAPTAEPTAVPTAEPTVEPTAEPTTTPAAEADDSAEDANPAADIPAEDEQPSETSDSPADPANIPEDPADTAAPDTDTPAEDEQPADSAESPADPSESPADPSALPEDSGEEDPSAFQILDKASSLPWRAAPTDVSALLSADQTKAVLTWTGNADCTGYAVYEQLESGYKVLGTVAGADNTTYTTKALTPGEHTFFVKARSGSAVGYASETVSLTVPTPWRTAPTDLAAVLTADQTKAVISWTGNDACTGYAIYEQLSSGYKVLGTTAGADKTSYTTRELTPGEHTFYVKTRSGASVGYASETVTLTVPDQTDWRTAPTDLTAVLSADQTKAVISWTGNDVCTGYAIYEQLDSGYRVLGTTAGADKTTYTTKALTAGEHTFYVKTRSGASVGYASETVTLTLPDLTDWRTAPADLTAVLSEEDQTRAVLTWTGNSTCTGYAIYEQLETGYRVLGTVAGADKTTYTTKALDRGEHRLYVKPRNGAQVGQASEAVPIFIPDPNCIAFGDWGELSWEIDNDGVLTVSGTGAMNKFSTGNSTDAWRPWKDRITSAVIGNGITSVGDSAFYSCANMTGVTLPQGLTRIGETAFYACTKLSGVALPSSLTVIGLGAFANCEALDAIVIPEGVAQIESFTFQNCKTLSAVTIPGSVAAIGNAAFMNCRALTSVTLPSSLHAVKSETFSGCKGLTAIVLPESVLQIDSRAFFGCAVLASVTIPMSVTQISISAFEGCTGLTAVYYDGAESDFARITVDDGNEPLQEAQLHAVMIGRGTWGDLSWQIDNDGLLTVSGTGAMNNFAADNSTDAWLPWKSRITAAVFESGITNVGNYALTECANLTSVTLPEGLTGIGSSTFMGCNALTGVTLPQSLTFLGSNAFSGCASLASVVLPDRLTALADSLFMNCFALTDVTLPANLRVISISSFYGCRALTEITIPVTVTKVDMGAFYNCTALADVYYDGQDTAWANISIDMFNEPLSSAALHCITTAAQGTFGDLSWNLLTTGLLTISGTGAMNNMTIMPSAWREYAADIREAVIEEGVTSIGSSAFYGCSNMTRIQIPSTVTSIATLTNASGLTEIDVAADNPAYSSLDGVLFSKDRTRLIFCPAGKTGDYQAPDGVTAVSDKAFYGGKLSSVTLPESCLTLGNYAFQYCANLSTVTLPSGLTDIGTAFAYCRGLTSLTLPDGITALGSDALKECGNLRSVSLPQGLQRIGQGAFGSCAKLTNITLPAGLTEIGEFAFDSCSSLTEITIPAGVRGIENETFMGCGSLTTVTFEGNVTAIGDDAFHYCSSLTAIDFPASLTWIGDRAFSITGILYAELPASVTHIGARAFEYCTSLQSASIPAGITALPDGLFSGCAALRSLTLPGSVTSVGADAFTGCRKLTDVYFASSYTDWQHLSASSGSEPLTGLSPHYILPASGHWGDLIWTLTEEGLLTISGTGAMNNLDNHTQTAWRTFGSTIRRAVIENGVTSVGEGAFYSLPNLTEISLPATVSRITGEDTFLQCPSLEQITVASGNSSLVSAGGVLMTSGTQRELIKCPEKKAGSYQIPSNVRLIRSYAFCGCKELTSVTIPSGITFLNPNTFRNCTGLTSVTLPDTLTGIGDAAFSGCTHLTGVTLPESLQYINHYGFSGCSALTEIILPVELHTLGDDAFSGCTGLTRVTSREGLMTIGQYTFQNCSALTTLILPQELTEVRYSAFSGCNHLSVVYYTGTADQWAEVTVANGNDALLAANVLTVN